jgi:hypothetical protein
MSFPPYVVRTKNQQMVEILSREAGDSSAAADWPLAIGNGPNDGTLNPELPQMMIQMLVHQRRPLLRR